MKEIDIDMKLRDRKKRQIQFDNNNIMYEKN